MEFRGRLLSGGRVVLDAVAGELWEPHRPESEPWPGYFGLPESGPALLTGAYCLELDDGRACAIQVTDVVQADRLAYFHSPGPPQ